MNDISGSPTPTYDTLPQYEQALARDIAQQLMLGLRVEGYIVPWDRGKALMETVAVLLTQCEKRAPRAR